MPITIDQDDMALNKARIMDFPKRDPSLNAAFDGLRRITRGVAD